LLALRHLIYSAWSNNLIIIIIIIKEAEKKLKYKSLCIEIQRMWNLKRTIVPVIIGATGIVTRSLKKNLEAVPGKHSIDSLQKTAILVTSHIIRKVLQCEAWTLAVGITAGSREVPGRKRLWHERSISYNNNDDGDDDDDDDNNNNNNNNTKCWDFSLLLCRYMYSLYKERKKFAQAVNCVILCLKNTMKFYTTYVLRCSAFVIHVTN
jgi:hypothetical protein